MTTTEQLTNPNILPLVEECAQEIGLIPSLLELAAISGMLSGRHIVTYSDNPEERAEAELRWAIVRAKDSAESNPNCPIVLALVALKGLLGVARTRYDGNSEN